MVHLDPGGELVVFQQNLTQSSMEALELKGRRVKLAWDRQFSQRVEEVGRGSEGPGEEEQ
jgi:hypothetical protein